MFAVYAAEQQYRHDTWSRQREHALLAAIRERRFAAAMPQLELLVRRTERPQRAAWARPIGLHAEVECVA